MTQTALYSYNESPVAAAPKAQAGFLPQKQVEAQALLSVAERLEDLTARLTRQNEAELLDLLQMNSRLWGLFYDKAMTMAGRGQEQEDFITIQINKNICRLANFVFRKTAELATADDKSDCRILALLNREIAAGLLGE